MERKLFDEANRQRALGRRGEPLVSQSTTIIIIIIIVIIISITTSTIIIIIITTTTTTSTNRESKSRESWPYPRQDAAKEPVA